MMKFQLSEATAARRRFPVYLVSSTDGLTPSTAENGGQPQLSKNGAAFGNTSATLTAISNGAYYVELTAGELDTVGFGTVRYASTNPVAEFDLSFQVISYDPYDAAALGLSNLNATVGSRAAPGDAMDLVANAVDATAVATDAIDADAISSSAMNAIADATLTGRTLTLIPNGTTPTTAPALRDAVIWPYHAIAFQETQSSTLYTVFGATGGTIATAALSGTTSLVTKAKLST